MANDKTEKATPKKKEEARKKGQVARSQDVNGAAVLLASIMALNAFGPKIMEQCKLAMLQVLELTKTPQVVDAEGRRDAVHARRPAHHARRAAGHGRLPRGRLHRRRRPGRPEADAGRDEA